MRASAATPAGVAIAAFPAVKTARARLMVGEGAIGVKQRATWSFLGMRVVVDGCADAEPRTEATSTATTATHPTHGTTYGLHPENSSNSA